MRHTKLFRQMSLLLLLVAGAITGIQAQATYLANVTFSSKTPQGWSIYPTFSATAPSWKTDTGICVSAKYAMHGYVPYGTSGDTSELITPYYDCTNYGYVMLRFNQICKVWPSDICEIQYQEDVLGSAYGWKTIPYDAYKGGDPTYRANLCFSHSSYTTWADYDSLAQPNNGWWKQETFDMSDYAGYSKVRFRFIIRKGSNLGSFIAAGWFIDDFQVIASKYELKPPVVEFISNLNDTVWSAGPFTIKAKVATRTAAKIVNPYLAYSVTYEGKTKKDSIRMKAVEGDSIWEADIPQQYYGSQISYSIFGRDANGNNARATGSFVNKRFSMGKVSGYVYYMPDDTTGATTNNLAIIYHVGYATSLSRSLYLASEINPKNTPMSFSRLAWYLRSNSTNAGSVKVTRNIKIWMLATNDVTTSTGFMDPVSSGATLVYDDTTTSKVLWNEVVLKKPFILPAGKNLYIFYEGTGGTTSSSSIYWAGHSQSSRCVYNYSGSWSTSTMVPLIRLKLGGANYDSNSVALASIDNPTEGSLAGKQPVKITIQNMGDAYLNSCDINWTVNGVLQTPKSWKGHLYTDFYDTLTLGYYTQKSMGYDTITVWVGNPNNVVDSVLDDDTLSVISFGCDSLLKGTYTVGAGGKYDFPDLSSAISILEKCGTGGDITLSLASGIYTEKLNFNNFNTGSKYRITIGSISGNADSVIFRPSSGPVVSLNNCSGLTFKNITFDGKKANPSCINMGTGLSDIEFSHCILHGFDTAVSNTNFNTIRRASGTPIHNIRFIGNEILGGSYGIYFYGSGTASRNSNIVFDSNHIADYYSYAGYLYYNNSLRVTHNFFEGARSGNSYDYGFISYYNDSSLFDANRFRTYNRNDYQYSLRVYYPDSTTIISNNEIILYNNNTTSYGLYPYDTRGTKIINNSVLLYGKAGTQYGIYTYMYASGSTIYWGEFKNNISVCHGTGTAYPIYSSSSTNVAGFDMDYNCWWSPKYVGYIGSAQSTLSAYQSVVKSAVHDIYQLPVFADTTKSLKPRVFKGLDCPVMADAPLDIDGTTRVGISYMGCYTDASAFVKDNAILVELTGIPEVAAIGDTICPYAVLQNGGTNTLTSATIALEIDNVAQGKNRVWNGKLAIGEMDTIPLGCYVVKNTGDLNFKAFLTGSQTDTITKDDTASYNIFICSKKYAGDYTIGPNGDFKSLNDALKQIGLCGLGGNVNLKYISGTYSENIDIFGLNFSQYHLTITSLAGNADSVIFRPKSGPVVTLNDASGLIFKNITFDAQKLRTTNIRLETGLNDIEFSHCKILGSDTAVSNNNFSNIYRASGAPISNIRFIGNEILGGSYGIYFYGSGTASRNSNIVFDSNHVADYYSYAGYLYYNNSLRVTNNYFEGARSGNSYDYGFLSYYNDTSLFNANRFRTYNRNNYQYGLRVYYPDSTTIISNNEIVLYNDNTTSYGLYAYYLRGTKVVNNSVLLYGKAGTQYGIYTYMYQSGSTIYWGDIKNNISVCYGTSTAYPIYSSSSTNVAGFDVDYNCWWSPKYVGYIGAAKSTLSAFQSTVTTAVHDMYQRPDFIDTTVSLKLTTTNGYDCPKLTGVDFDLIGNTRGSTTTIGAYTKVVTRVNATLISIVDFPEKTETADTLHPSVILANSGMDTLTEVTLRVLVNDVSQGNDIVWKGSLATDELDTVSLGTLFLKSGMNKLTVFIVKVGQQKDSYPNDDTTSAESFTCAQKYAGTFTVGANGHFKSIQDAIDNLMNCGIGGPVTLSLLPGTYRENITLGDILGMSATNTLTFTSSTGDSTDVVWQRADDATKTTVTTQASPLVIDGASYVIVKNLTLTGMAPNTTGGYSSSHAIVIVGMSHDIEVSNCHLYVPKNFNSTVTSHNHSSLYIHDGGVRNIHVHHNLIEGGATGCYVYGSASADRITNVTIDHNNIGYIDYSALYAYYTDSLTFHNNTAVQRRSDLTPANAYMCYTYYTNANITCNRFDFNGIYYGFYIGYFGNVAKGFYTIANNEVRGILTSATGYGTYITGGSTDSVYLDFIHNSIAYDATGTTAYGFYAASSYIKRAHVKNNIIHMRAKNPTTVYPIYISSTSYLTGFDINYNCFYNEHSSQYVGYAGGAKSSITAWQQTVTTDNGSVFMEPAYVNINNSLDIYSNKGITCPTIGSYMTDINGVMRARSTNMGAYQLQSKKLDISLEKVNPDLYASVSSTVPLSVRVRNIGTDTITSMEIGYILNGVKGNSYLWKGSLAYQDTTGFAIDKIQLKKGYNQLTVFCYNPNKGADQNTSTDTLSLTVFGCDNPLSGTYKVGGSSADFTSLNEALDAAKYCGLSGPVDFAVATGSYSGISLSDFNSGSTTNTVTIRSAAKNRDSVIISGGRAFNMQEVSHIILENITLKGDVALNMKGNIEDLLVHNCNIHAPEGVTNSAYRAVNFEGASGSGKLLKDVRFIGNDIRGGYYNFYLYYFGSNTTHMRNASVTIDSNTLSGAYYYGIYTASYGQFESISHNQIKNGSNATTFYAIYMNSYQNVPLIEGNSIRLNNSSTSYGIYMSSYNNYSSYGGSPGLIANNELILTGNGSKYGIYRGGSYTRYNVVNNSVYVKGSSTCYAMYGTTCYSGYPMNVMNNLLVNDYTTGYALYRSDTSTLPAYGTRDYNNYYSRSGNLTYLRQTTQTTLKAIQSLLSSQDQNSMSTQPVWKNAGPADLELKNAKSLLCPVAYNVDRNILGELRTGTTTVGCYGLVPDSTDVALISFYGTESISSVGTHPLYVIIANNGVMPLDSATINFSIDGIQQNPVMYKPANPLKGMQQDTVSLGTFAFKNGNCTLLAYTAAAGDINHANDTIQKTFKVCNKVVSGKLVIGNSAKADYSFTTIGNLVADILNCGVSGDVTLLVESGKYAIRDTLNLSLLGNLMGNFHLTISSLAENRDSVSITSSGAVVLMGDNKNITIENLTLIATTGNVIVINGPCENIHILNNHLKANTTGSSNTDNVIYKPSGTGLLKGFYIIGNKIEGGYYGNYLYGESTSSYSEDVVVDSNEIFNQYYYANYFYYTTFKSISHNNMYSRSTSANTYWYGMRLYYCNAKEVCGNFINATKSTSITSPYGMYLYYVNYNLTSDQALFANNVIRANTTGTYYGTYMYYSRIKYMHNSVLMSGTGQGRGLYYSTTSSYPMTIMGNMFVTDPNQYPIYAGSTTSGIAKLDYNNYYGGGTYVGYHGSAINSLSSWQSATGEDANSVSEPVTYINPNIDQKLKSYSKFFMPLIADVTCDYEGLTREKITAMGAYTPEFFKIDATLTDFAKSDLSNPAKAHVEVTLANYGTDTLTSAAIEWVVNGVAQTPVKWNGSLLQFGTTTVELGNLPLTAGQMTKIVAWVTNPNGKQDQQPNNDTVTLTDYICNGKLAGNYKVGGTNPDFATMDEAVLALSKCGVSAPVTLTLRSSITTGVNISGVIPGSSSTNTITVVPDANSKVVIDKPNDIALNIGNTSHWRFLGLTIGNTKDGMIGVQINGQVENILFRNCNINASTTATTNSYKAVSYPNTSSSSYYPVDLVFVGNNIQGGYYNMYLYYPAGSTSNIQASSITVDSNVLGNAYYYGIYAYYNAHYKSMSHNTITNRANSTGTYYGIYNYYYCNVDKMEGNRVHVITSGTGYGIYWGYYKNYGSYNGKPGVFANNDVIVEGAGGAKYGIYFYLPYQSWEVYHNSVFAKATSGTGTVYGIYAYNSSNSYKITLKNNLFVAEGTGTTYPIYASSYYDNSYLILDYNNYVNLTGGSIGYAGSAISSLSSWQTTTGQDKHSVSVRPSFVDSTRDMQLADYTPFVCPRVTPTPVDINGDQRTSYTTMGCYGVQLYEEVNLQVENFVTPEPIADVVCYADYTTVSIAIKNAGLKKADFTKSPLKVSLDITGAINYHFDTTYTTGGLIFQEADTLVLTTVPTIASGVYHMKITLNDTADKTAEDDTISLAYNASRVELPYDIDFTTVPNEFVNATMAGETAWKVVKGSGSNPAIAPAFGTGRLEFAGASDPGAYAHAIFNAVNIQNCTNPKLIFWYAHSADCSEADMLTVLVTTDGGQNYTEVRRILVADTATAWKQYEVDLSAFTKSSCLSVVFRAMSFGGANQSIDRIRITADQDAALTLLPIDISERSACDNTPVDVKAVITNLSRLNIDMFNDTITLNVTGAVNYSNRVVFNQRLGDFESDTITLGQISLANNGSYYFNAWMQSFDDRTDNDTISDSTLFIAQDIALDSVIGIDNQMLKMTGDTVFVSGLAVNNGNIPVNKVIFHMGIDGNHVVTDTIAKRLYPGDTLIHPMSRPFIVPAVHKDQPYYFFELKTELACDADNTNDVINIVGQVNIPDSIDIQVLEVTTTERALGKTKLSPTVRVANIGNMEADNIVIHVDVVDNNGKVVDSISENISHMAVNETKNHDFTMTYKVPDYTGMYTLRAYVEAFDGDAIQSNDTIAKQFRCFRDSVGIADAKQLDWSLGQNIPNPASSVTAIPFTLPQAGTVRISVMTANGQVIFRQESEAEAGANRIEVDASDWAAGVYYYTMEYRGQRITRKMNITR